MQTGFISGTLFRVFFFLFFFQINQISVHSQTTKQVNHQSQTWFSVNTVAGLNKNWSLLLDAHTRRTHFLANNSFNFLRAGVQYAITKNSKVAAGYAHLWLYPTAKNMHTVTNENRIYQQFSFSSKWKNVKMLQRIRNEQRWQQQIVSDEFTGKSLFSNRVRYLVSFTIPVFKNAKLPALAVADEIMFQAGKEIVYNSFDQNRIFIGIKQRISATLSFDTGYMLVYQQKKSGYQYDLNQTYRLFFYYTPAAVKSQSRRY